MVMYLPKWVRIEEIVVDDAVLADNGKVWLHACERCEIRGLCLLRGHPLVHGEQPLHLVDIDGWIASCALDHCEEGIALGNGSRR